jgi:hypothetical protein
MTEFDRIEAMVEEMRHKLSRAQEIIAEVARDQKVLSQRLLERAAQVEVLQRALDSKGIKVDDDGSGNGTSSTSGALSVSGNGEKKPARHRRKRRRKGAKHGQQIADGGVDPGSGQEADQVAGR